GLEFYSQQTGSFTHFRPNTGSTNSLNHGYVSAISEDHDGNIWIGTSTKGLNIYNPKTKTFSYINTDTKGRQLVSNYIKDVLVDSKGNVWVGTVSGINLLKKGANKAITFTTE